VDAMLPQYFAAEILG